jgi:hypothetical protein
VTQATAVGPFLLGPDGVRRGGIVTV